MIICPRCQELNTESARRCVGVNQDVRCDYYFEFKECPNEICRVKNDIAARHCRACNAEIIDPNDKLTLNPTTFDLKELEVIGANFNVTNTKEFFRVNCLYKCRDSKGKNATYYESYTPSSEKAKNVFYGQFVRKHCVKPSDWYMHLQDKEKVTEMLQSAVVPNKIMVKYEGQGYSIKKKVFEEERI